MHDCSNYDKIVEFYASTFALKKSSRPFLMHVKKHVDGVHAREIECL